MVEMVTRKAFRNGSEGMVRAGQKINVSVPRAADLERLGLATYAVGAKMQPAAQRNKMVAGADGNKGDAPVVDQTAPAGGSQEAPAHTDPTPIASAELPAGSLQESQDGGQTGETRASRSSSRQGRRRKKST